MSYIKHAKWDEMLEQAIDRLVEEEIVSWCKCDVEEGDNCECPLHNDKSQSE